MSAPDLCLTSAQRAALIEAARSGLPEEICGILGGIGPQVEEIFPVSNVSSQPAVSFYMDPTGQFRVLDLLDRRGWHILALYHSHPPGSRTDPSETDRRMAAYPGSLQVIVVPGEGVTPDSVRAFDVTADRVIEVPIRIE